MTEQIESAIFLVRGQRVILDSDLATLYGVTTKRLNEQIRRNSDRFPEDFMFQLEYQEVIALRSQIATSKGGRRYIPYVFTEHGVVMVASVLSSKIAIDASIVIVRTFIKMRMILSEHTELKRRLHDIERKVSLGFSQHEHELQEIRFMISELETPKEIERRKIGFVLD